MFRQGLYEGENMVKFTLLELRSAGVRRGAVQASTLLIFGPDTLGARFWDTGNR